LAADVSKTTL